LHGIVCGPNCKCTDCKNFEGSEEREQAMIGSGIESSPVKRKVKYLLAAWLLATAK